MSDDDSKDTRDELVTAVKHIGMISECLDIQNSILKNIKHIPEGAIMSEEEYKLFCTLWEHMYNAVKRSC